MELCRTTDDGGVVELLILRQGGNPFADGKGVAVEGLHQLPHRHLDKDFPVVEDDTVVDQPLHILDDMGGEEDCLVAPSGVVPEIVDEEAPVAGVEPE